MHDGARPAVSPDLILRVAHGADLHGAAVPVVPLTETIKEVDGDRIVRTLDRVAPRRSTDATGHPVRICSSAHGIDLRLKARRNGPTKEPCSRPVPSPSMQFQATRATSK